MVERQTLARVTISRFVSLSPASGSVLTAWRLEPVSESVFPVITEVMFIHFERETETETDRETETEQEPGRGRERGRRRQSTSRGGAEREREREGDTESESGSRF